MGGVSSAPGAVPTTALFLPPRSPPMSGTILLYTLYAQTAKTILVDRILPGTEFIDRQRVAAARLLKRKQTAANRGNNLGFPMRHPTFCSLWRQIGDRQRRTVRPNNVVASWPMRLNHDAIAQYRARSNDTRGCVKIPSAVPRVANGST